MSTKRAIQTLTLLAFLASSAAWAAQPAQPSLVFSGGIVTVQGVTPGADVYLFGVSREGTGYYNRIVPRETILHDTTKSGHVDYTVGRSVPLRSIWFAVDMQSGQAVAGTPANYSAHPITVTDRHLKKDANGDVAALSYEGALVDAIVVRPGVGVWAGTIGIRGKKDEGNDPHFITVSAANLDPRVGTTAPAPAKLKNGDVVFMMDSYRATYSYVVLGGQK